MRLTRKAIWQVARTWSAVPILLVLMWSPAVRAQQPACCNITAIDSATGIVTAKVNDTGQVFQFKVTNAATLQALKIGQGVYANFQKRQVSLDDRSICCNIVNLTPSKAAPVDGVRSPSATSGSVQMRFNVSQIQGGYRFHRVSAKLMSHLVNGANVQITLDDPTRGKSTVTGVVTKIPGQGFQIKTPERLSLSSTAWLLVRGLGNTHTPGEPPCGGCPRDAHMDMDPDETTCWCFASASPIGSLGQQPLGRPDAPRAATRQIKAVCQ